MIPVLSLTTLFSYSLLDWQWQQQQGGWNYWVAGGGTVLFAIALRQWRNDPRRLFDRPVAANGLAPGADGADGAG